MAPLAHTLMDILLVVREKLIRDQVKVGLQQFPEFNITVGEGYAAINEVRQHDYHCIFLAVDPSRRDGMRLLQHLRSFDSTTEVVAIAAAQHAKELAAEKSRLGIGATLHTPLDVTDFFRLLARLRSRHKEPEAARR